MKVFLILISSFHYLFFSSSNPGVKTIEQELVNALFNAEAITEDGKANLGKVGHG